MGYRLKLISFKVNLIYKYLSNKRPTLVYLYINMTKQRTVSQFRQPMPNSEQTTRPFCILVFWIIFTFQLSKRLVYPVQTRTIVLNLLNEGTGNVYNLLL